MPPTRPHYQSATNISVDIYISPNRFYHNSPSRLKTQGWQQLPMFGTRYTRCHVLNTAPFPRGRHSPLIRHTKNEILSYLLMSTETAGTSLSVAIHHFRQSSFQVLGTHWSCRGYEPLSPPKRRHLFTLTPLSPIPSPLRQQAQNLRGSFFQLSTLFSRSQIR